MAKRKLRIGFDFDGVIAYNPLRIFRPAASLFKRLFFRQKRLNFYVPKTRLEKMFWALLHETSVFPAMGFRELRRMIKQGELEVYVITARYAHLEPAFWRWLKRHNADKLFAGYYPNRNNEQPHKFKARIIEKLTLDIYIDDNWDIVNYLNRRLDNSSSKLNPSTPLKAGAQSSKLNSKSKILKPLSNEAIRSPVSNGTEKQWNKCEIHWIYNILDRNISYPRKHPFLLRFLEHIAQEHNFKL